MQAKLGVVIILQNQKGEFLLHLRDGNTPKMPHQWSLVGGAVDPGELPKDAVIREVKEETNFDVTALAFLKKISIYEDEELYVYHGYVNTAKQKMVLSEGKKLQFFTKTDFEKLIATLPEHNPFLDLVSKFIKTSKN